MSLHNLRQQVRQEIRFLFHGLPRPEVENAELHELIESFMPVYTADLLELVQMDQSLALNEPEFFAYNGRPTPMNALAANIFDHLIQEAEDERHAMLEELES